MARNVVITGASSGIGKACVKQFLELGDRVFMKLCAYGRTREEAIARMKRALYEYVVLGVTTNIPFHKAVMECEAFHRGELSTGFIDDNNIIEKVKEISVRDSAKGSTLASALEANEPVIAAITAAVGSYVAMAHNMDLTEKPGN